MAAELRRLITEARVVAAMERFDLALVLWAVRSPNRARVLLVLLDGPAMGREIVRRSGVQQASCYKALKELMGAWLVVGREKAQGRPGRPSCPGPRGRVYEIAPGRKEASDE